MKFGVFDTLKLHFLKQIAHFVCRYCIFKALFTLLFTSFAGALWPTCIHLQSICPDRLRGSGTAATNMCLVATGAVEAFFEIGIHCWDIAAGAVIVKEAGGVLLDVDGAYDHRESSDSGSYKLKSTDEKVVRALWLRAGFVFWRNPLMKALSDTLGGPFDLMSRRMVSANNEVIAKRIIKEIEIFPAVRDDAPIQKQ